MDIELNYEEYGSGPAVILLHGNDESLGYFKELIPVLSPHFRLIAIDTRGHGLSPRGEMPFTLQQFADDLHDFMVSKSLPRAHILGFSDGANTALLFAMKYPSMVDKLILNGGNFFPSGMKLKVHIPVLLSYGLSVIMAPFSENARRKKELLGLMALQPHIRPSDLENFHVPTLIIAGSRDVIRYKHIKYMAAAIPDCKLSIIEGTHFVAAEHSLSFGKKVMAFLDEDLIMGEYSSH